MTLIHLALTARCTKWGSREWTYTALASTRGGISALSASSQLRKLKQGGPSCQHCTEHGSERPGASVRWLFRCGRFRHCNAQQTFHPAHSLATCTSRPQTYAWSYPRRHCLGHRDQAILCTIADGSICFQFQAPGRLIWIYEELDAEQARQALHLNSQRSMRPQESTW